MAEVYRRVFADELLGPVFLDVARADLAVRQPVMCDSPRTRTSGCTIISPETRGSYG